MYFTENACRLKRQMIVCLFVCLFVQQRHQLHHVNPSVNLGMDDDDMYVDRNGLSPGKIPRKQLQMTNTLAEGRFAVVRRAHLDSGREKSVVAAKALKSKHCCAHQITLIQTHCPSAIENTLQL